MVIFRVTLRGEVVRWLDQHRSVCNPNQKSASSSVQAMLIGWLDDFHPEISEQIFQFHTH